MDGGGAGVVAAGLCCQEGAEGWDFIPKSKETQVYEEGVSSSKEHSQRINPARRWLGKK